MNKNIVIGVLVVLALLGAYFYAQQAGMLGAASGPAHYQKESFLQGIAAGQRDQFAIDNLGGVTLGAYNDTTCNLSQSAAGSHAASSTKEYFCSVTGVVAGDTILAVLPAGAGRPASGTASTYGGFIVNTAYATTTGRVGLSLYNASGAATSSIAQATTSVKILFFH